MTAPAQTGDVALTPTQALLEFHEVFGHEIGDTERFALALSKKIDRGTSPESWRLRRSLIGEEYGELIVAANAGNVLGVADALADLLYVIVGTAVAYGSPHETMYASTAPLSIPTRIIADFETAERFPTGDDYWVGEFGIIYGHYYVAAAAGHCVSVGRYLAELHRCVSALALVYGIPLDAMFAEVHRSNMSKLGADGQPIYREVDRKVLKGPNYTPPNLPQALAQFHASLPFEQARANLTSEEVSARVGLAVDRNVSLDEAHGILSGKR